MVLELAAARLLAVDYLRMPIRNDTVQPNLVEVWCFQLEHFVDTLSVDLICSVNQFLGGSICSTERVFDELLAVFVK